MKKLIIVILSLILLTGCSVKSSIIPTVSGDVSFISSAYLSVRKEDVSKALNTDTSTYQEFLTNVRDFSTKFIEYYMDGKDSDKNYLVSPLSLYMAMSLVVETTANSTRQELLDSLNLTYEDVKKYTSYLYRDSSFIRYKDRNSTEEEKEWYAREDLNNSIWLSNLTDVSSGCLDNLSNYYYADTIKTDFQNNNTSSNKDLTQYVSNKTNGLIDRNFEISKDSYLLLVNTLYIKDVWKTERELSFSDKEYEFTNSDSSTKKQKFLVGEYLNGVEYEGDNFKSYHSRTSTGLMLTYIVPKQGSTVYDVVNGENILLSLDSKNYIPQEGDHQTRCIFPEFTVQSNGSLKEILQNKFSINELFSSNCDFSSLTKCKLFCSDCFQASKLIVNKKGVEGAAVTIFENKATSVLPTEIVYHDFVVDSSFAFILSDSNSNILFGGCVNKI